MRNPMIFAKGVTLFLLLVLVIAGQQARAQNQTPANAALVGWTDPATGLTWTTADNGSDVNWDQAKAYCSNLRLGEYSDWRLPTIDELWGIYDTGINIPGQWSDGDMTTWHVKGNLKISGGQWSSSQLGAKYAWRFAFNSGNRTSLRFDYNSYNRALCVRR
jgi:hypothetical protein